MAISDGFENDLSSVSDREESEENLSYNKNSLSRFGVKLWNEITCHIRDLPKTGIYESTSRIAFRYLKKTK